MSKKFTLSSATLALCGVLALSACQSSTPAASGPAKSSNNVSAPAAAPASDAASSDAPAASNGTAPANSGSSATTAPAAKGGKTSAPATGNGNSHARDDDWAWKHECTTAQLTVNVTKGDTPSRRVISVRNNGSAACGVSYFPQVDIGNSKSADHTQNILPLIPGGLGGAPNRPIYAGETAYAVLDLNPSGATSGTVTGMDEINVLADDSLPNSSTKNFPLGGASVLKPKLGLYMTSVADAISSMKDATVTQQG